MLDIEVIEDPAAAEASLDPIRTRILQELAEPGRPRSSPPGWGCRGRR